MEYKDYCFLEPGASHMHRHFMPIIFAFAGERLQGAHVLDVGCGNGYTAGQFAARGCHVVGVDLSKSGIEIARKKYPQSRFEIMGADADFLTELGEEPFDLIVSTEVVEHLYSPRSFAKACFNALKKGGRLVCTTPYHGYLKNLAIALTNKFDSHVNPLWDGGHIKLWSRKTLSQLLQETGFARIQFKGAGRVPYLWMTMVMAGDKPLT